MSLLRIGQKPHTYSQHASQDEPNKDFPVYSFASVLMLNGTFGILPDRVISHIVHRDVFVVVQ